MADHDLDFEEDDEDEKKYEKVLDHIRLSNGPDRKNNENFYAHKMNQLAENGKVFKFIKILIQNFIIGNA